MKYSLYTLAFLLCFFNSKSQTSFGFGYGRTLYFGDLGNEKYVPLSEVNHGISISLKRDLNLSRNPVSHDAPFAVQAQAEWLRIGYDETQPIDFGKKSGTDLRNFHRGLNFRNDLIGFNLQFIYTIYFWKIEPLAEHHFALYFFIGPGFYHSDPHADLFRGSMDINNQYYYWDDGSLRNEPRNSSSGDVVQRDGIYETDLRDWFTEGQSDHPIPGEKKPYSSIQIGFPHGGGIKYGISRTITFQYEWAFYDFPFTDYIDDVSSRYATYEEIARNFPNDPVKQALARYITDPSGWGSDGENGPQSSRRGNYKKFDWTYFMNVQLFFTINNNPLQSYKPKKHRGWGNPKF